ncbi:MAG: hypothetical protein M3Z03_07340 [Actinomycetota bacterium]|nr:hypothetical protein [Actinomycetota bacterium]
MFRLTTLLRSLGHQGALANVQAVLESRVREDWLVEGLSRRLDDPVAARTRQAA